jgi:hypothetical protein
MQTSSNGLQEVCSLHAGLKTVMVYVYTNSRAWRPQRAQLQLPSIAVEREYQVNDQG